jgi:hypothetical protein
MSKRARPLSWKVRSSFRSNSARLADRVHHNIAAAVIAVTGPRQRRASATGHTDRRTSGSERLDGPHRVDCSRSPISEIWPEADVWACLSGSRARASRVRLRDAKSARPKTSRRQFYRPHGCAGIAETVATLGGRAQNCRAHGFRQDLLPVRTFCSATAMQLTPTAPRRRRGGHRASAAGQFTRRIADEALDLERWEPVAMKSSASGA